MERVYIASSDEYDYFGDDLEELAKQELKNQVYDQAFDALEKLYCALSDEQKEKLGEEYDVLLKNIDQLSFARCYIERCVNQRYGEKSFRKELKEWLEREYEDFIDYDE